MFVNLSLKCMYSLSFSLSLSPHSHILGIPPWRAARTAKQNTCSVGGSFSLSWRCSIILFSQIISPLPFMTLILCTAVFPLFASPLPSHMLHCQWKRTSEHRWDSFSLKAWDMIFLLTSNPISCQYFECGIQLKEWVEIRGRSLAKYTIFSLSPYSKTGSHFDMFIVAGCL